MTRYRKKFNQSIIEYEIKLAMFDINPQKSPTLDSFNAFFFQEAWEIMGP